MTEGLAKLVVEGDLARLTPAQRTEYYGQVCTAAGLNPVTRPLLYLTLNGKMVLYATAAAAQQLTAVHGLSTEIQELVDRGGVLLCRVRVTDKDGRSTENVAAVPAPGEGGRGGGEAASNAWMRVVTKAMRRGVLAHVGLGVLDETEVASTDGRLEPRYDAELPSPARPPAVSVTPEAPQAAQEQKPAPSAPEDDPLRRAAQKRCVEAYERLIGEPVEPKSEDARQREWYFRCVLDRREGPLPTAASAYEELANQVADNQRLFDVTRSLCQRQEVSSDQLLAELRKLEGAPIPRVELAQRGTWAVWLRGKVLDEGWGLTVGEEQVLAEVLPQTVWKQAPQPGSSGAVDPFGDE